MTTIEYCIFIYVNDDGSVDFINEICAGIEEEGVLFEIVDKHGVMLPELCLLAVENSAFGCGIGVIGNMAAVSFKNFRVGEYAFCVSDGLLQSYRNLGINAARAIKKLPFVLVG